MSEPIGDNLPSAPDDGSLSKSAGKIIDCIARAVGLVYQPIHVRRMARAEADAQMIETKAGIERNDLLSRATYRVGITEARRQKNIESILDKALESASANENSTPIDEDWMANFFESCKDFSDEEMRGLWGKVLAGESEAPGTYDRKTLNTLRNIDKADAILISRLAALCWGFSGQICPIVPATDDTWQKITGLHFQNYLHLQSIGIISFDNVVGYQVQGIKTPLIMEHHGKRYVLQFPSFPYDFNATKTLLTAPGRKIVGLCQASSPPGYIERITALWMGEQIHVVAFQH